MPLSRASIDFLIENRLSNSSEWFHAHKQQYRTLVVDPLAELVTALAPTMDAIDAQLVCDPRIGGSISRVRRDTRFSRDKTFYRDTAWLVFLRDKRLYEGLPAFFFEFSPTGFRYGCGYYTASLQSLASIRRLIVDGDPAFLAAKAAYDAQAVFSLQGERYKRSPCPEQPEELRFWLDRKNVDFICDSTDFDLLFSDRLADTLAAGFSLLAPEYRFLIRAEQRKEL